MDIEEFTPLARMAMDTFVLWVNADSDIQTLDDYVAAVKAAGGSWKMGGTGTGQEDSLVTAMLEKEFGIQHTYVPFKGGGTVAKNLVGNHINATVNNPAEQMGFWQAGKVRPIVPLHLNALRYSQMFQPHVNWATTSFIGCNVHSSHQRICQQTQ